jgi:predicted ArsR family transcriptional regulator
MARPTTAHEPASPGEAPSGTDAPTAFTAAVSAITDAFGDPTRRRIYLFTRDCGGADGVTVSAVADEVGVHPNVARHHLDKLAAGGYVEVVGRGAGGERRAGRPSKRYLAVASNAFDAGVPVRSDDLVLALLGRALDRLPRHEAEAMAEEVGATYGRAMAAGLTGDTLAAGQRSLRSAMQAVADALTAHGFAAHMSSTGDDRSAMGLRIINDHCPFGTVATDHPVICAVDRGMVRGMLSALYGAGDDVAVASASSKARGDTICATAV